MSVPRLSFGPFVIDARVGGGGMGEVLRGVHRSTGDHVAIKVVTGELAQRPTYRRRFRREVRAVAGLCHPGITTVIDYGELDGAPAYVMELATHGSLGRFPLRTWANLRRALLQVLDALAHAHARGLVHRDLKPANVLVSRGGEGQKLQLKLCDFGIAHDLEDRERGEKVTAGTPGYMPPEQIRGRWRDYGPWTDLYALGCLGWALACRRPPFKAADPHQVVQMQLVQPPPAFVSKVPVPDGFEAWLRRLLEKRPEDRFQHAADAAWALERLRVASEAGDGASPSSLEPPAATLPSAPPSMTATTQLTVPTESLGSASDLQTLDVTGPPGPGADLRSERPPLPASFERLREGAPAPMLPGVGLGLWGLREVPFVDRDEARGAIWESLRTVLAEGRPRAVLVRGPAGCGKSRLAEWMAVRAQEVGAAELLVATHAPVPGATDGLAAMVARRLRSAGMGRDEVYMRVRGLLEGLGVGRAAAPAITELVRPLGLREPDAGVPRVRFSGALERWKALDALLAALAARRPVLVWLDDAQWAADALGWLQHALAPVGGLAAPVLVVATVRDDALAERREEAGLLQSIGADERARRVDLGGLGASDQESLVSSLLGLDRALVDAVCERSEGNPLFAVQLVGDWVQQGVLVPASGGFQLAEGAAGRMPADVRGLWATRVEEVVGGAADPARARRGLELAAALGQSVEMAEWVAASARVEGPDEEAAERLVEALLARRMAHQDGERWWFTHGMLRDVLAAASRAGGRWASLNEACAQALDAGRGGLDRAERIARHLIAAGRSEDAFEPLAHAVSRRTRTGEYAWARGLLADLEAMGAEGQRAARVDLLASRLAVQEGRRDEAVARADAAREAGDAHGWPEVIVEAELCRASVELNRGDFEACMDGLRRAEARLDEVPAALRGECLRRTGEVLAVWGRHELADFQFQRAAVELEAGDPEAYAHCLMRRAVSAKQRGRPDEAVGLLRQARRLYEQEGARRAQAQVAIQLGDLARMGGRPDRAEDHYLRALALFTAIGAANRVIAELNLGLLAAERGAHEVAIERLERTLRAARDTGQRHLLGVTHLFLLLPAAGRADRALWDAHESEARTQLAASGWVDVDFARAAEQAAELAASAGWPHAGQRLRAVAVAQYRALGRAADARRLDDG